MAESSGIDQVLYTGANGTEETLYSSSNNPNSILHLATHGFYYATPNSFPLSETIDSSSPLSRCGLVLARGQHVWAGENLPQGAEDGIVLGSEICRQDLSNVNLVVLSACNTALGDFSPEGVSGLRLAFKMAGAHSILMTLGRVDDKATAFFMKEFYQKLFSCQDTHIAYKYAIDMMRASDDYNNARYWANYILID